MSHKVDEILTGHNAQCMYKGENIDILTVGKPKLGDLTGFVV